MFVITATSRECVISITGYTTFDGLRVPLSRPGTQAGLSGCWSLMSRDRGASLYAVLARGDGQSWTLLHLVPGHEIKYTFHGAGPLVITVNGERMSFGPSHPIIIPEEQGDLRYDKSNSCTVLLLFIIL